MNPQEAVHNTPEPILAYDLPAILNRMAGFLLDFLNFVWFDDTL